MEAWRPGANLNCICKWILSGLRFSGIAFTENRTDWFLSKCYLFLNILLLRSTINTKKNPLCGSTVFMKWSQLNLHHILNAPRLL